MARDVDAVALPIPVEEAFAGPGRGRGRRVMLRGRHPLAVCLALALACLAASAVRADDLARGDASWARRADGERDGRALPGPIGEAIEAYAAASEARPAALEPRWKLLRALHFAGEFAHGTPEQRRAQFERGTRVSEDGIEALGARLGGDRRPDELETVELQRWLASADVAARDVARLYFWSAIHWGAWARSVGLLGAVREGVANRLERYTRVTLSLEPDYEEGGALRLLGRLHAELPRVPFLSSWVDRARAIPLVERAYALAPEHPGNRLLLALTLLDLAPSRRDEAFALLRQVAVHEPRPAMRVEELALRETARERLAD